MTGTTQKLLSIIFFSMIFWGLKAQPDYNDFTVEKDIQVKADMGVEFWNHYLRNSLDSLKMSALDLMLASSEADNEFGLAVGHRSLGSYLIRSGQVSRGISHLKIAKKYFELKENNVLLSETWNEIGNGHRLSGKYKDAIDAYKESLKFGKLSNDPTAAFSAEYGMGNAYLELGDTSSAVTLLHRYKNEALKRLKFEAVADAYAILGMVAMNEGNMLLSKEYYAKSIAFSAKSNSKAHLSHALNNKAILHFNIGELDSCLFYFKESLELREKLKHTKGVIESYFNIGSFYMETENWSLAEENFRYSAEIAEMSGFNIDQRDALEVLSEILKKRNRLEENAEIENKLDSLEAIIEDEGIFADELIEKVEEEVNKRAKMRGTITKNSDSKWNIIIPALSILLFLIILFIKSNKDIREEHIS